MSVPGKGAAEASSEELTDIGRQLISESGPARGQLLSQLAEALRTGGVGAQLPSVQRALEATRYSSSTNLRQIEEQLARSGLANTPFSGNILAQARTAGALQEAQIPTQITADFLRTFGPAILGATQIGSGNIGTAGQISAGLYGNYLNYLGQLAGATAEAIPNTS